MARIGYSDDEDYPGQFALWRGNVNRSLQGKGGQKLLTELREALLAMPSKRLISHALATDGEVCAVGALLVARSPIEEREAALRELEAIDEDTEDYAATQGVLRLVAWAVVEENDMTLDYATPEERYERMLKWIDERLAGKSIIISW